MENLLNHFWLLPLRRGATVYFSVFNVLNSKFVYKMFARNPFVFYLLICLGVKNIFFPSSIICRYLSKYLYLLKCILILLTV